MGRKTIKSKTDQRPFVITYIDFYKSKLLDIHEKWVFIALKIFADSSNQCFPSLKTLSSVTGLSKRKIQDILKTLEQKQIITIERRKTSSGSLTSNLYSLNDYAEMWNDTDRDMELIKDKAAEIKLIAELRQRGYTVTKEKEPDATEPTKDQLSQTQNPFFLQDNVTTENNQSQEENSAKSQIERYTLDDIKQLYDYNAMICDYPQHKDLIDIGIDILHDTLNSGKKIIRVNGESKPSMIVIGKLMKLSGDEIMYAIEAFSKQTKRIKNPRGYLLTLLYNAKEQMHLDLTNQVQYDLYGVHN